MARGRKMVAQAKQSLSSNCCSRAIDRLPRIEGVGRPVEKVSQVMKIRRTGIPHGDAVGATVGEIKLCGGRSRLAEASQRGCEFAPGGQSVAFGGGILQLLGRDARQKL